jgi:hypothetical protein
LGVLAAMIGLDTDRAGDGSGIRLLGFRSAIVSRRRGSV